MVRFIARQAKTLALVKKLYIINREVNESN